MTESDMKRQHEINERFSNEFARRCGCTHVKVVINDITLERDVVCELDGKSTHPLFCVICDKKEAPNGKDRN